METPLRGHPDKRPALLGRPLDNVNININALISIPDQRPPLLKGQVSDAKDCPQKRGSAVIHIIY